MSTAVVFEYMEWVIIGADGWQLKDDAPKYVVSAFNEWQENNSMTIVTTA